MNKLEEAAKAYQEKEQKLWEQSIQLEGFYAFSEALVACPPGYRIPTRKEWCQFVANTNLFFDNKKKESVFRFADGFELRLPAAGYRHPDGDLYFQGRYGFYWSSSTSGAYVASVCFSYPSANVYFNRRTDAFSVRCVPIEIK